MRQHARTFIARCACCQLMSQIAPIIRSNPFTLSHSKPMHSLAIDTIGPLPEDEKETKLNEQYIATKNKKYKDMDITEFPVNSYVLLSYPPTNLKKGPPNKLMLNWQGPYKLISYIGGTK